MEGVSGEAFIRRTGVITLWEGEGSLSVGPSNIVKVVSL